MSGPKHSGLGAFDDGGCVTAGRATGTPIPPPSEDDLRRAEEAWNDPAFYDLWQDEPFVGAGWVPKPAVDPNRRLIPSAEEVMQLPRRARVAFAARCARRVFPIVKTYWANAPMQHILALHIGISSAEHADEASYNYDADLNTAAAFDAVRAKNGVLSEEATIRAAFYAVSAEAVAALAAVAAVAEHHAYAYRAPGTPAHTTPPPPLCGACVRWSRLVRSATSLPPPEISTASCDWRKRRSGRTTRRCRRPCSGRCGRGHRRNGGLTNRSLSCRLRQAAKNKPRP